MAAATLTRLGVRTLRDTNDGIVALRSSNLLSPRPKPAQTATKAERARGEQHRGDTPDGLLQMSEGLG